VHHGDAIEHHRLVRDGQNGLGMLLHDRWEIGPAAICVIGLGTGAGSGLGLVSYFQRGADKEALLMGPGGIISCRAGVSV
jgi:hypothetical protein